MEWQTGGVPFVWPPGPHPDVLVLGAGFSKDLWRGMPTTDELGNLVRDRYLNLTPDDDDPKHFEKGLFETWFSRLAEDQPYLQQWENLRNRTRFTLYSDHLAVALEDRVRDAVENCALSTPWLPALLGCVHIRRATVLTFNQDTLVERAVAASPLAVWDPDWWPLGQRQPTVGWFQVQHNQPPVPFRGTWYGGTAPPPSFRLIKLHGSTNWYWYPNDRTGATMATWHLAGTAQGEAAQPDETTARQRLLPGRKAFIVPPSATKSAFYDNPVTVQLWQSARQALSETSLRLSLLGYSLPLTDLVTASLFRETVVEARRPCPVPVEVANTNYESVRSHLNLLGVLDENIGHFDAIGAFAQTYLRRAAEEFASTLLAWEPSQNDRDWPIAVGRSMANSRAVGDVRPGTEGEYELVLAPYPDGRPSTPVGQPTKACLEDRPPPLTVEVLLTKVCGAKRFIAVTPAGQRTDIVGAAATSHQPMLGIPGWQMLLSAEELDPYSTPKP